MQYQRTCEQSWSGIVTAKVRWFGWSSVQRQSPALDTRLCKWWFTVWSCIFPRIHHWGKEDYAYVSAVVRSIMLQWMETLCSSAYSVRHIQPLHTVLGTSSHCILLLAMYISDSHLYGGKCAVFIFCRIFQMLCFQDHREPDVLLFLWTNKMARDVWEWKILSVCQMLTRGIKCYYSIFVWIRNFIDTKKIDACISNDDTASEHAACCADGLCSF